MVGSLFFYLSGCSMNERYVSCAKCDGIVDTTKPHFTAIKEGKVVYLHRGWCVEFAPRIIHGFQIHSIGLGARR